mmetsp:Transcript_1373/g.2744  ORF Transcript_1373/g.2744 Transcript_1373/m.2744 type:complete len:116 (+) Transcript_1373:22-369(+)|eukprot:CAMPEP_0181333476 /NCGR_PEP_ID=MMETSP1101-20121128/25697_1 /TAXON_ID=46948 /ORGANISM="Rhodomonas abbreviata, Strain Caron Lab Isolate" /LENGTH=115 /DNA_ID=CAMNT_0023443289 /DNA_START=22 /DNA_END=369 /DNA_ORIENTATION=+
MPSIALVLTTSTPSTMDQEGNQRKVLDWMTAFKIEHKVIDGADQAVKELRNELFTISGQRGKYPQVFLTDQVEKTEFIGDYEKILSLVEDNSTPEETLKAAGLKNFHMVFADAKN